MSAFAGLLAGLAVRGAAKMLKAPDRAVPAPLTSRAALERRDLHP
jgi:predicted amidophosphoribosyltransferase